MSQRLVYVLHTMLAWLVTAWNEISVVGHVSSRPLFISLWHVVPFNWQIT